MYIYIYTHTVVSYRHTLSITIYIYCHYGSNCECSFCHFGSIIVNLGQTWRPARTIPRGFGGLGLFSFKRCPNCRASHAASAGRPARRYSAMAWVVLGQTSFLIHTKKVLNKLWLKEIQIEPIWLSWFSAPAHVLPMFSSGDISLDCGKSWARAAGLLPTKGATCQASSLK